MTRQRRTGEQLELLQGTLDMIILRTLRWGPAHGHAVARFIQETSGDAILVEHGSLYPALQRLQKRGWITARWGASENNRRAKYYELTPEGREHLSHQHSNWRRFVEAVGRIMRTA
jgi:transcriptional regulator